MNHSVGPRIIVSKCLGFESCRYDGGIVRSKIVRDLEKQADFLPICPEMEISLGVPRRPIIMISFQDEPHLIERETGRDLTNEMRRFIEIFLDSLEPVEGFILKSSSPSCGLRDVKIYTWGGIEPVSLGPGLFGSAVVKRFPNLAVEDEASLENQRIHDKFMAKIFKVARSRSSRRRK